MRVIAILAAYNEERYIGACLEHYAGQGIDVYLIDNSSTDRTVEIAEGYRGRNLVGIETAPRDEGVHRWARLLERKEELAQSLDADWFIHADPDEIRLPPSSAETLAGALARVDEEGYNAVNFLEFTFVPTQESPDHDHPDFQKTMRSYYPFFKHFPYRINAWKRQPERVDLVRSGGHRVKFPDQLLYPESFKMRHYQFLSLLHSRQKYLENKKYPPEEVQKGMHGWRARMDEERFRLPSGKDLHTYTSDDELTVANPRMDHVISGWSRPEDEKEGASPAAADLINRGYGISRGDLPIIVGGCYGSGTSLVRRILDAHPRIHCGPEVKFFRDFYDDYYLDDPLRHGRFATTARQLLPEFQVLRYLGRAFVGMHNKAAMRAGKPRWADGSPENVINLQRWQKLLGENWLFVHVVRNPLDTLASTKEAGLPLDVPPDLEGRIDLYRRYNRAGLRFGEAHPDRYYRLLYERLVDDPEHVLSDLMAWLGEEFSLLQLNLDGIEHHGGFEDPRVRETKAVHAEGVGRWRDTLTPEEIEKISKECDPIWRRVSDGTGFEPTSERKGLLGRLGL